ncbi:hypothetical protein PFISCL1PPCAC_17921, partial [Pristionchus fissidentatus]
SRSPLRTIHSPSSRDIDWAKKLSEIEKKRGKKFPDGLPLRFQMGRMLMMKEANNVISLDSFNKMCEAFDANLHIPATRHSAENMPIDTKESPSGAEKAPTVDAPSGAPAAPAPNASDKGNE